MLYISSKLNNLEINFDPCSWFQSLLSDKVKGQRSDIQILGLNSTHPDVTYDKEYDYKCKQHGKSFVVNNKFKSRIAVRCTSSSAWNISTIDEPCDCKCCIWENLFWKQYLGSHCINPPVPDAKYKLQLHWNYNLPPAHYESIRYECNAGSKWNRFESDFNEHRIYVQCLPNNQWKSVDWPTCKNGLMLYDMCMLQCWKQIFQI